MKRFIIILSVAVMAVSCFNLDSESKKSYTLFADFEFTWVDYPSSFGADSLMFDSEIGLGIGFDYLGFYHKLNAEKTDVAGGFIASYLSPVKADAGGNNSDRLYDILSKKKNTYLVYRNNGQPDMPEHDIQFMSKKYGTCTMVGCYVTNTVEAADSVLANFEVGDRLTLKATGYLDGSKTGEAEIALADFSAQKDSIVSTWTAFNLSKLGSVEYVEFTVTSTKPDVPLDFCLDDMIASIELSY